MKQIFNFFFLLFFVCVNAQDKNYSLKDINQNFAQEQNDFNKITKLHLESIFSDLILSKKLTKKKIEILNNYQILNSFNFSTRGYLFASIEKTDLNVNRANQIFFWRMDISSTNAHYEFYLTINESVTEHFSYMFEFKEGKWNLKVKI